VELSLSVVLDESTGQEQVAAKLAAAQDRLEVGSGQPSGSPKKDIAPARPISVGAPAGEIQLVELGEPSRPAERASVDVETKVKSIHTAAAQGRQKTPTFAFVNGRAGGGQGLQAIKVIGEVLGKDRVYNLNDLAKQNTTLDQVLARLLAKSQAPETKEGTRPDPVVVIAAGGDGTVNWVMNSLIAVQDEIVPFVVVPLPYGTGNDLHRAFGWGSAAPSASKLKKLVMSSQIPDSTWTNGSAHLDTWELMTTKCKGKSNKMQNYFSIGLMADMALGVDNYRNNHPKLTKSRPMMKNVYAAVGAKKLAVRNPRVGAYVERLLIDGQDVPVPSTVKDIIVLNIPSMISGMSPWRTAKSPSGPLDADFVDDGKVEVLFAFNLTSSLARFQWQKMRNGCGCCGEQPRHWAKTSVLQQVGQGSSIKIVFKQSVSEKMAAQVDGEPWLFDTQGEAFEITSSANCPMRFGPTHRKGRVGVYGMSTMWS